MLLAAKARLAGSADARHAFAASVSVEIPSGDRHRESGSGLVDYGITLVSQHRVGTRWTVRANGAVVLAGNTQTGVVGIKERGTVLRGGSSLVAKLGSAVQLAEEGRYTRVVAESDVGGLYGIGTAGRQLPGRPLLYAGRRSRHRMV